MHSAAYLQAIPMPGAWILAFSQFPAKLSTESGDNFLFQLSQIHLLNFGRLLHLQ